MGSYLILDISTKFQLPKQYDSANQCNCTFRFKWGENQYRCANSVKKETIFQDIEVTNFQMINCFSFFFRFIYELCGMDTCRKSDHMKEKRISSKLRPNNQIKKNMREKKKLKEKTKNL